MNAEILRVNNHICVLNDIYSFFQVLVVFWIVFLVVSLIYALAFSLTIGFLEAFGFLTGACAYTYIFVLLNRLITHSMDIGKQNAKIVAEDFMDRLQNDYMSDGSVFE